MKEHTEKQRLKEVFYNVYYDNRNKELKEARAVLQDDFDISVNAILPRSHDQACCRNPEKRPQALLDNGRRISGRNRYRQRTA
jgi:hypothetical protein